MNILLIAALLLTSALNPLERKPSELKPTYTKVEILAEYDKAQKQTRKATKGKVHTVSFGLDTTGTSILSSFFRENYMFASYLFTNHEQVVYEYHKRMKPEGTIEDILKDSLKLHHVMFERFLPLISNYLNAQGSKIEGYEPWKKPEISVDKLTGNAVKFFYPDSILPTGRIMSHVCVGFNGFQDLKDVRTVLIEAFCFSVVNESILDPESPLLKEFNKAMDLAQDLQLSSDPATKLKRFQGVVWAYMSQSKVLRELLLHEYEKKKHLLTFTVKAE